MTKIAAQSQRAVKSIDQKPTEVTMVAPKIPVLDLSTLGEKFCHSDKTSQTIGVSATKYRDTRRQRSLSRIDNRNGSAAISITGSTTAIKTAATCPPGTENPEVTPANFSKLNSCAIATPR